MRRLAHLGLDGDAETLVVTAFRAAAPGPSGTLVAAGADAGLSDDQLLERASLAFVNFTAFNLSDDLSDGDCDYLAPSDAAVVLLILCNLFFQGLHELGLPAAVHRQVADDLVAAEQAQLEEISTTGWTAPALRRVTDGIAGRQWAAYLRILWWSTPLEHLAGGTALSLGRVLLLAGDIESDDARYHTLSEEDRRTTLDGARSEIRTLSESGLRFTADVLQWATPVLDRARRPLA